VLLRCAAAQVLQGLRMTVAPTMPAITLTKAHQTGGLTAEQAATEYTVYTDEILLLAKELLRALAAVPDMAPATGV
jgi:hypothetical protein